MIHIVPATRQHATDMAPRMRSEDAHEVEAMGLSPCTALLYSLAGSVEAYSAFGARQDYPIAMWGAVPRSLLSDCATLWMLGTDEANAHPRILLRASRAFVDEVQARYPVVEAWVIVGYTKTIRWLLWLGFVLEERTLMRNGHEFHIFRRRR